MTSTSPHRQPATAAEPVLAPVVALTSAVRRAHPAGRSGTEPGATRRPAPSRPDPARLAGLLVRLAAEVAAGRRPLHQLEPLLAPTLARRLAVGLRPGGSRPQDEPVVRRVVAAPPTPSGAVEATVLVERRGRVTAVAVRLERHHGAWRATEMTAPEAGYAALPTRSSSRPERELDAFDEVAAEAAAITRGRDSA